MNAIEMNLTDSFESGKTPWLEITCRQVGSVNFGGVQVAVYDSRVVQIERTEKVRFDKQRLETFKGRPE